MEDICARVGFNIRKIREAEKFSQEKLANLADLHRAYMGQIERGEKKYRYQESGENSKGIGRKNYFDQICYL